MHIYIHTYIYIYIHIYIYIYAHFHHTLQRSTVKLVLHLRIVVSTGACSMADSKDIDG